MQIVILYVMVCATLTLGHTMTSVFPDQTESAMPDMTSDESFTTEEATDDTDMTSDTPGKTTASKHVSTKSTVNPMKTTSTPKPPITAKHTVTLTPVTGSTGLPISGTTEKATAAPEKSSDVGTIVGVAIGMLLVGLLFGVGGAYMFWRYRSGHDNRYELNNLRSY